MRTVHGITPHGPYAAPHLLSGPLAVTEGRPRAESISLHKLSAAPLPRKALRSHARACFREHRNAISFRRSGQPTPSRSTTKRRDRPDPSRYAPQVSPDCAALRRAWRCPAFYAQAQSPQASCESASVFWPSGTLHACGTNESQVCTPSASSQLTAKAS